MMAGKVRSTDRYAEAAALLRTVAAVLPHTDADGLASAAIALRFLDKPPSFAVLLDRSHNPFNAPPASLPAGTLAILDQGIRAFDRAALFVDHHAPETDLARLRADQLAISGHSEGNGVSTSVLMKRIVPDAPAWLAAIGAAGDYGDEGLKRAECAGVVKAHVKKLVPLINAPRRCPDGPVRDALHLLLDHENPKAALADERIELLEQCRVDYRKAFDRAIKIAPKLVGSVMVIRFVSPYQVHPLVAQTWSRRLAPKPVLAANDDYVPGRVNFAMRTGTPGQDLRTLLRTAMPDAEGEFANGHAGATGGSLSKAEFERLLSSLGESS